MTESIVYTGRNATEVREWLRRHANAPEAESWVLTRGMAAATGGQAWRYVRDEQKWPDSVNAALYDPVSGAWAPLYPDTRLTAREGLLDVLEVGVCDLCGQEMLRTRTDCWHPFHVETACPPEPSTSPYDAGGWALFAGKNLSPGRPGRTHWQPAPRPTGR